MMNGNVQDADIRTLIVSSTAANHPHLSMALGTAILLVGTLCAAMSYNQGSALLQWTHISSTRAPALVPTVAASSSKFPQHARFVSRSADVGETTMLHGMESDVTGEDSALLFSRSSLSWDRYIAAISGAIFGLMAVWWKSQKHTSSPYLPLNSLAIPTTHRYAMHLQAAPESATLEENTTPTEEIQLAPGKQTIPVTSVLDGFVAVGPINLNTPVGNRVEYCHPDGRVDVGVLLAIRNSTGFVLFETRDIAHIKVGDQVTITEDVYNVAAGNPATGRILGALGAPQDDGPAITPTTKDAVLSPLIQRVRTVDERKKIRRGMFTGVKLVDMIAPLGCGQFLLVIGEHNTGKTSLAIDAVLAQRHTGVLCVYAALSKSAADSEKTIGQLKAAGALAWTTVVTAPSDASTAERVGGLFTAFAIGEAARDNGRDVLLLLDDLSCLPDFWKDIVLISKGAAAGEKEGDSKDEEEMVEYEGMLVTAESAERRRLFSTTIQRAAQMSDANGGGSLSVLGLVQAIAGAYQPGGVKKAPIDISKYETLSEEQKAKLLAALQKQAPKAEKSKGGISGVSRETIEEYMSICDGQIFLEEVNPEVGWNPSVVMTQSRLGLDATSPAMRQLEMAKIRLDLLQAGDAASFSVSTEAKQRQQSRAATLNAVLCQKAGQPLSHGQTVAVTFALQKGYCNDLAPEKVNAALDNMLQTLASELPSLLQELNGGNELSASAQEELHALMQKTLTSA